MKSYFLILISAIFLFPVSGCKKKSFDPSGKSREDFVGTWKGSISTFKNNKLMKENGTIVIYTEAGKNTLSGVLFMNETSVLHEFQFIGGTFYFKIVNNDPLNPACQTWSLGGYAAFPEEGKIDIHITGNECGPVGSEFINWIGTMQHAQVSPDSMKCYTFAKNGNLWTYMVTLKNGDSCHIQKQINQVPVNYSFNGATSQPCGWTGQGKTFRWDVSPAGFSIMNDTTLSYKGFNFPVNAKLGVVYSTYIKKDTTTVTLLDTSLVVTTPAGSFTCIRFRYTEPVYHGVIKISKTAYLWLNNRYGIIKQEVVNPVDSNAIQLQVLSSKNF